MSAALWHDVRHAVRSLWQSPGFALGSVVILGIGIGATTAMFSAIDGVLLRPLPYANADRLVRLSEGYQGATPLVPGASLGNVTYFAWKQAGFHTLEAIEGYNEPNQAVLLAANQRELVNLSRVTPGLFPLLGIRPTAGRLFRHDDGLEGKPDVLVMSARLWRDRFGSDPSIVGQQLSIGGRPYTLVGVADPSFAFPNTQTNLWGLLDIPQPTGPLPNPEFRTFLAIGRLRPAMTAAQASAEGTAVARRRDPKPLAAQLTFGDGGPAFVRARAMAAEMTAGVEAALVFAAAGVGCILLLVCVNVANLLLCRGAARQRELAVRRALGASQWRLTRLLLAESVTLSLLAAVVGTVLAFWIVKAMVVLAPADFPRLDDVVVNSHSLGIALLAATMSALAAALPALRQTGKIGNTKLEGRRSTSMRSALLASEAACAVVILISALMLGRSFVRLMQVDPGYTPEHVLVLTVLRPGNDDESARRYGPLMTAALEQIRSVPGVEAAAIGGPTPLDRNNQLSGFPIPGAGAPGQTSLAQQARRMAMARSHFVSPGFDRALGLRIRAGRFFSDADLAATEARWVVNEEFARLYLPADPAGKRFPWSRRGVPTQLEIIGVVANVLKNGNSEAPRAEAYFIRRDADPFYNAAIVVRTNRDAAAMSPALRAVIQEAAPDAVVDIAQLTDLLSESVAQPRLAMAIFGAMAALAVLLTGAGIFAALSHRLVQRTREFGVRIALGATRAQLIRVVLRDGTAPTVVGIVIGMAAAAGMTQLMRSVLFGISPLDAFSFAMAPVLLIPIALAACVIPALRASRVDPIVALHAE